MGTVVTTYCDGCGDEIGEAGIREAIQITAQGANGLPAVIRLCTKAVQEGDEQAPKINGCARKVLTETILTRFYADVREYTGDEKSKPFVL